MGKKRNPIEVEQNMEKAATLIGEGATGYEAAASLNIPKSTFYHDWGKWCKKNQAALKERFAEEIEEYFIKQRRVYRKAMSSKQYGVAAHVNKDMIEKLQSLGIVPKVKEQVELSGQVKTGITIDDFREAIDAARKAKQGRSNSGEPRSDGQTSV